MILIKKKLSISKNGFSARKHLFKKEYASILLVIIASVAAYSNSIKAPFIFDDLEYIVENPAIKQFGNIGTELIRTYRPLTQISFALNYYLGGLNTQGYHIFNVFIHIISAILLFFLTRKIFSYSHNKSLFLFPLFTSLVFACHPINTEVVTYIYNRSASLSTLFYLLSLLLFIKSVEGKRNLYPLSVLSFVLSFLSKEMALTLPVMLLAFDYIFLSDFKLSKVIEKKYFHIPFWIVSIILLLLQFYYFKPIEESNIRGLWPGYSYYLTQPWVVMKYLKLLLIPTGLCIDHQFKPVIMITEYRAVISYIFILCIFIIAWKLYKNRNNMSKAILFGIIWFFVTLLPTNIFIVHIGERHLYLSGIGFYIIVSALFLSFSEIYFENYNWKFIPFFITPIIVLSISTIKRNKIYQNSLLIWQDVILQYPNNEIAYNNRGAIYLNQSNLPQSLSDFNKAIQINPENAEAYNNRGIAYKKQGNTPQAISDYNKALQLKSNYIDAYSNRGNIYQAQGNFNQALSDYNKAIQIDSKFAKAYYNRGNVYKKTGDLNKALSDYNKAIQNNPDYYEAYNNRGLIYQENGEMNQALSDYNKVLQINPDLAETYNNRGIVYKAQGNVPKALSDYNKALQIDSNMAIAYNNRGNIYKVKENFNQALSDYNKALQIAPDFAEAYTNRGDIYYIQGNLNQSLFDYNKSLQINQNNAKAYNNRAMIYFFKREYDKSWEDVRKAEGLGYKVNTDFIDTLKKASNE